MLIYKISNSINDRIYIGQTTYDDINKRIECYYKEVRWARKERPIISAMRKYGFDNFTFEIIDTADNREDLDKLERYYIKEYRSLCTQNGYNVELGGNSDGKHSEETKRKISEAQLGEKNHMWGKKGKDNPTSRPVIDLTTGKRYDSATEVAKELNKNDASKICAVCRGDRGSTYDKVFRYLDKDGNIIKVDEHPKIRKQKVIDSILPEYKEFL